MKEEDVKTIEKYYGNGTHLEASMSAPFQQRVLGECMQWIKTAHSSFVLDLGSGLGYNLDTLHRYFSNIVTADISHNALSQSRTVHAEMKLTYLIADAQKLPFKANIFDIVVITEVLEHVPNMQKAIDECHRVLKRDGYIYISTPNYNNLIGLKKKIKDRVAKREYWEPWGGHKGGMERHMTPRELHDALKRFKIIHTQGGGYLLPWTFFLPFFKRHHDKFPLLGLGRLSIIKKLGMQYFILAQKR